MDIQGAKYQAEQPCMVGRKKPSSKQAKDQGKEQKHNNHKVSRGAWGQKHHSHLCPLEPVAVMAAVTAIVCTIIPGGAPPLIEAANVHIAHASSALTRGEKSPQPDTIGAVKTNPAGWRFITAHFCWEIVSVGRHMFLPSPALNVFRASCGFAAVWPICSYLCLCFGVCRMICHGSG
eukprot:CAMPEP_0172740910 /NCGR_PEP_ID=MMETSP1074-20121228/125886_1 /TAXON_ID=2916 /ORGANISM="Ceratium fusus, Strain PA161109" /LENGTH=176 /DNA_ID=CAMNT_0013571131 /DNA_START=325 /DNA_END=855 /DNA_ORIENTATION=-